MDERLAAYQSSSKIQGQNELRFVTCSRLTRWKRIDRAIRFVYFVKVITGRHFHLTIVGEGEERESLENLVHSLNLDNNTTFAGALLYNDALENIAKNDYYIVFNDLSNMGNQICESIMLGLIPLTIDDGSTDSLLRNGYNSIKFPMCTDFERNAARIFVSGLDDSNLRLLKQNLCETKNHVFTWRERNRLEYYFMFGNVQGETGTH